MPEPQGEAARGGFGGRRWPEAIPPIRPLAQADRPGPRTAPGFGGSGWREREAPDREPSEQSDDSETEPRRRRPAPPSPYPRLSLPALSGTVRVVRDACGVPHLFARSEHDAWVALGFCMAEDRLWQMDLLRRLATGRAAEALGPALAHHDALVRTAGVPRRAAAAAAAASGLARDVLAAFTAGVNAARVEIRPAECELLGCEVEPWTIADSLAIELLASWSRALRVWPAKLLMARVVAVAGLERARWIAGVPIELEMAGEERAAVWRRIDPRILDLVAGLPGADTPSGVASAISAQRTQGGAPLLLAAPGGAETLPGPGYAVHLEAQGIAVAGLVDLGSPILRNARSRRCAWATVSAEIDDADCVLEELDGIGNFRAGAEWVKLAVRREVVRVRGGESLHFEVAETRHGPLVSHLVDQLCGAGDARSPGVALRWGGNPIGSAIAGWVGVMRARNLAEVASAAEGIDRGPLPVRLVAADADGAVGSWLLGGCPVRDAQAKLPVRGWLGEAQWRAVEGLSRSVERGEAVGGVVVAGAGTVAAASVELPTIAGELPGRHAARRLAQLLGRDEPIGTDTCAGALRDVLDLAVADVLPEVRRALDSPQAAADPRLAPLRPMLLAWRGEAAADSAAAALTYLALLVFLPAELFPASRFGPLASDLHLLWPVLARLLAAPVSPWFAGEEAKASALCAALGRAADWLREQLGGDSQAWSWGAIHRAEPRHPLATEERFATGPPTPAAGSAFTVWQRATRRLEVPFTVAGGPVARMIVDLASDEVQLALPAGESGRMDTAHALDQAEAWREGRLLTLRLTSEVAGEIRELVSG